MTIGKAYSSKLKCTFHGWEVIADGEIALNMPDEVCCDMRGAVEIAEVIMPSVFRIATFAGGKPDMEYLFSCGKWTAFDARPKRMAVK